MNHDCKGDFFARARRRWYRCFMDGSVHEVPLGFSEMSPCPRCNRTIDHTPARGGRKYRTITQGSTSIGGQLVWVNLPGTESES